MPRWTEQARQRQSKQIQQWQPWQDSTGPRSPHGKRMSSKNGYREGINDPRQIQKLAALGLLKCLELEQEFLGEPDAQGFQDLALARSILEEFSDEQGEPPPASKLFPLP